jgi:ATP-dependent helicase HrpB
MLGWDEGENEWQARIMSLRNWRPAEGWPDVSEENLLASLEEWLTPSLLNVTKQTDLQRLDLHAILSGILPWELGNKLETLAPSKLEVPSGSMIKLSYHIDGQAPVMAVRLQEVFGLLETPMVNNGKMKVMMHLLSPGHKPVQVTQDLHSFWQNTYHGVRKELRMRYPRHSWPEDPWTAKAVRGAIKKRS